LIRPIVLPSRSANQAKFPVGILIGGTSLVVVRVETHGVRVSPVVSITGLAVTEIRDVNVGPQPQVIGQLPTDMVWVFVDDDLISIPEPVATKADVIRSHAEIKAAEEILGLESKSIWND
jgi:hypothetical protein